MKTIGRRELFLSLRLQPDLDRISMLGEAVLILNSLCEHICWNGQPFLDLDSSVFGPGAGADYTQLLWSC